MGITKEEFTEKLKNEVQTLLPNCEVKDAHVTKINDVQLTGLTILKREKAGGPTYYIDEAYEDFTAGAAGLKEMAISMVNYYLSQSGIPSEVREIARSEKYDLGFEKIKGMLGLRLVEKARNRRYLEDKPYKDVGCGLALVASIKFDEHSGSSTVITNSLKEEYGYDMDEVFKAAENNTFAVMRTFNNVFFEEATDLLTQQINELLGEDLYVVSSKDGLYGAAGLFVNGVKEHIRDLLGTGYYILPSSVHEMVVLPDSMTGEIDSLKDMVKGINASVVDPCEQLSDEVYHYDTAEGFRLIA